MPANRVKPQTTVHDAKLTPAQQQVFSTKVATTNATLSAAFNKLNSAYNGTGLTYVPALSQISEVAVIKQQVATATELYNASIAQGKSVLDIAGVPESADPGRARLKVAILDYQRQGTAFLAACSTAQKSISNTTFAGILQSLVAAASTALADAITAMLNAIGDLVIQAVKKTAQGLDAGGWIVVLGLLWLTFSSNAAARATRRAATTAAGAVV